MVGTVVHFQAGDRLSSIDFELCESDQSAVRILHVSQHPDLILGVRWHLDPLDTLQVLVADDIRDAPFLQQDALHEWVVALGVLELLVAVCHGEVEVAVVQHVGPLDLGHLASGPVLEALEEFVDADAVSRSEWHEVHLPRFLLDVEMQLLAYNWPGNIRQLRNVRDSAVVMAEGNAIEVGDLGIRDAQSWISIGDSRTSSVKLRSEATRCVPLTRITRRLTAVSLKSAVLLTEERCH